jgi:prepilin-type N-terminal cleavage/methylation domain-containing protein
MPPIDCKSSEAGLTLIETMIGIVITGIVSLGGYQMMTRSQKYLAYKQVDQVGKTEVTELISIVKKDWEYRQRLANAVPGGIPPISGFSLLTAANVPCTSNCPKLRLWINRKINSANVMDVVTIENVCQLPADQAVSTLIGTLNYNTSCGTCPRGQIPAVKIEGIDDTTKKVLLAAENRLFPQNAADLKKINPNGILGMQACFSQGGGTAPLSIDVRSFSRDQSSKSLRMVHKTQVYPFANFASITLEQ